MGANQSLATLQNSAQSLAYKPFPYFEHQFWNQLWDTPTTPAQLWTCLNDTLLTQMRDTQPANFATLLFKTVQKLVEIVYASKGTAAQVKPLQPFANTFTASIHQPGTTIAPGSEDPVVLNTTHILLNCVRILTRCLSVMVEQPHGRWYQSYLWGGDLPLSGPLQGMTIDPLIAKGIFGGRPLGQVILLVLLDLLFVEGFCVHVSLATTVPNKLSLRHNGVQLDKLYEIGFSPNTGAPVAGPPNLPNISQWLNKSVGWSNFDSHRIEVLRCLMTCFGDCIFLPPPTGAPAPPSESSNHNHALPREQNRFLREFVSETSACAHWTPTLFWSLLNIILNFRPEGTALLQLPYNYALYNDNREPLVECALHFLLMLLDFRRGENTAPTTLVPPSPAARKDAVLVVNPPTKTALEKVEAEEEKSSAVASTAQALETVKLEDSPPVQTSQQLEQQAQQQEQLSNVFHAIFTELSNAPVLTSIYTNICRLLMNALMADSTYLPQSMKRMYAFQELLILMWKLADENPAFVPHVLHPPPGSTEQLDVIHLITPLLYFVYTSRTDDSQLGLMYTCVFLLLKLSGDREFSVALNRPVGSVQVLAHIPYYSLLGMPTVQGGTYADCLIVVAHKLIVSSPNHLDALLKVLLTLLCNVSPYLTKLSLFASVKLLNLFELFASAKFVHANSTNHQYATMLIDALNNIIQYQYLGHANLVYSIIRRAKQFYEFGRLEVVPDDLTAEEQHRASQQQIGAARVDLRTAPKANNQVTSTIELAERGAVSPHNVSNQPGVALPTSGTAQPTTTAAPGASLPSSTSPEPSFVPTAQWANQWKRLLPLEPIYRLLEFFEPKIDLIIKGQSVE